MTFHPAGVFVPLVTPFTSDGDLAHADLENLAHDVVADGAAGIVALGTTAEPAALSVQERRDVLRICSRVCRAKGVPLIVGAGSNDTAGTVRAIAELHETANVTAALVVVPYYTRPTEDGVVAHFRHIADRSPLPLVLYNVPYRTGRPLGWESITALATHPRIVGIKQAVGCVDTDTALLLAQATESFAVLAGEDTLVWPLLASGAAGAVLATANVYTRDYVDLFDLARSEQPDRARRLAARLVEPATALMAEPNPTVIKAVLHAQGRISTPNVRLPLLPADVPPALVAAAHDRRMRYSSV